MSEKDIKAAEASYRHASAEKERREQYLKTAQFLETGEQSATAELVVADNALKEAERDLYSQQAGEVLSDVEKVRAQRLQGMQIDAEQQAYEAQMQASVRGIAENSAATHRWIMSYAQTHGEQLENDLVGLGVEKNIATEIGNISKTSFEKVADNNKAAEEVVHKTIIDISESPNLDPYAKNCATVSVESYHSNFNARLQEAIGERGAEVNKFITDQKKLGKSDSEIKTLAIDKGKATEQMFNTVFEIRTEALKNFNEKLHDRGELAKTGGRSLTSEEVEEIKKESLDSSVEKAFGNKKNIGLNPISINQDVIDLVQNPEQKELLEKISSGGWKFDDKFQATSSISMGDESPKMNVQLVNDKGEVVKLALSYDELKYELGDNGEMNIKMTGFSKSEATVPGLGSGLQWQPGKSYGGFSLDKATPSFPTDSQQAEPEKEKQKAPITISTEEIGKTALNELGSKGHSIEDAKDIGRRGLALSNSGTEFVAELSAGETMALHPRSTIIEKQQNLNQGRGATALA